MRLFWQLFFLKPISLLQFRNDSVFEQKQCMNFSMFVLC